MKKSYLILILLICFGSVQGQQKYEDTLHFKLIEKPLPKWVLPASALSVGTAFLLDNWLQSDSRTPLINEMTNITNYAGDKYVLFPGVAVAYGVGKIFNNQKLQLTAWQSLQSLTVTALAAEGVKQLTGRARPHTGNDSFTFSPFPGSNGDFKSLPSGHAGLAFAAFTPFAENYSRWIYLLPVSVAFGRVYQNKHWFSDVVLGSSIGFVSGWLFTYNRKVQLLPNGIIVKF